MRNECATLGDVQTTSWGRSALAVTATAASAGGVVIEVVGRPGPVTPAVAVALGVVSGLCLLVPRPVVAAWTVIGLCAVYHLLGFPGLAPAVALFVALYRVTAEGDGRRSIAIAAVAVVAVSAVPLAPPGAAAFGWSVAGPAVGLAALAAMGEAARARRSETARQLAVARDAATQEARRREAESRLTVAREVHDVLAHTVTVIAVQAAAAAEALDQRPEEARAGLAAVRQAAREAMGELRSVIALLRTPADEPGSTPGLPELASLCDRASTGGLAVRLTVTDPRPLPEPVERATYRIVQEALTNTTRHAGAAHCDVTVEVTADTVRVEIRDDGTGAAVTGPPGHGLLGMRERAHALGGTLEAGPLPGRGFQVRARLPARAGT